MKQMSIVSLSLICFLLIAPIYLSTNAFFGISPHIETQISYDEIELPIFNGTQVEIFNSEQAFEGLNIFDLTRANRTSLDSVYTESLVITDMDGNLILEGPNMNYLADFYNATTVICHDHDRNVTFWNLATGRVESLDFGSHHDIEFNLANQTLFTLERYFLVFKGYPVAYDSTDDYPFAYDSILEYDLDGNLVWQLNTSSFIGSYLWCPMKDLIGGGVPDITHTNSMVYDDTEDVLYLNCRNVNTFYKIDHKTGEVIWGLGENGDFKLYDIYGNEKPSLFYHSHALERIGDNRFILFDNDYHNQTNPNNMRSRIVEIEIDEDRMIANQTWVWTSPPDYFSSIYGDADRLPNGNRIGTFGTGWKPNRTMGATLAEVTSEGELVWAFKFLNENTVDYNIYRMERFRFNPIVSNLPDIQIQSTNDTILTWNAWYDHRNNYEIEGHYEIIVDNSLISNETLTYTRYWQPTEIQYTLHSLNAGVHNITIVLYDDIGNSDADSVQVTVHGSIFDVSSILYTTLFLVIGVTGLLVVITRLRVKYFPSAKE